MSVTVMRHICFIECPYHKSIPPTGKLAMPNFPHYQKKKPAIKLNPMNFFTINITSNKRPSCFYIQLIHLPQNSRHLGENNGSIRLTEGTVVQTRLLAPWKLLRLGCSVQGRSVFGNRFGFAFRLSGARFEKPVSLVLISLRKTRNCNCDVQFLLVHFVHGLSRKLEIRHFLESCWWWFRAHFPEILNAMLVAREGRWFSVSISSKRVYIYMSLLHCKHFYTCFKI